MEVVRPKMKVVKPRDAPPLEMWFKCEKYRTMGDKYMETMKGVIDAMFDIHKVEGVKFNILFEDGHQLTAKRPLNKEQINNQFNQLEKLAKEFNEDEVEKCDRCGREDVSYCQSNKCLDHIA